MKHDVSFVTCVYDDIHNTNLAGRHNRGTHYAFSLAQMHSMGVPIHCFTDKINLHKFFPAFLMYGHENFNFISYNLWESPYHQGITDVKMAKKDEYLYGISWQQRCVEIMWAKFDWLIHVLNQSGESQSNDKYTFWIDGGLSHEGILPKKYNTIHGTREYKSSADEYHDRFKYDAIFNPDFPDYLVDYMEGKDLLHFMCTQPQHNDPHPFGMFPKKHIGTAVGGLFGGRNRAVLDWATYCKGYCDLLLREQYLLKEEDILSYAINKKIVDDEAFEETLKFYKFDTWYHADWDVYNPRDISFSDFFEPFVNR